MGLSNYTSGGAGNSTPPSGGGGSTPPLPPMAGLTGDVDDIKQMLINYNERFKNADPTLFRDEIITQTISVLIGKNKPNALLVGAAGTGKTKIAEDIARRIENDDPLIPASLKGHTVFELPLSSVVAGAGIVGQLEERVTRLIDFVCDPGNKAILFIDEIHLLTSDRSGQTYEKIAQILKPALARGDMHVIGATTLQESRSFDDDPAFNRRFSRLIVDELNREQTQAILRLSRSGFAAHYKHKVSITDDVLEAVTVVADEYAKAGHHRPDNALTLLDRSMADAVVDFHQKLAAAQAGGDTATVAALNSVPSFPVTERRVRQVAMRLMTGHASKENLNVQQLEQELSRIQGQDDITAKLAEILHRDDLGVFPRTKPIAWLFAGPSGVGKTEVSKIIAKELTEQEPIILNMTEFHSPASINRIIGSPAGYVGSTSNTELPFDSLESNPYRVILLDELEKCDMSVQRLFLSAFDEGYIMTSRGKKVDFSKAIVIATTNAAKKATDDKRVGFGDPQVPTLGNLVKDLEQSFEPEFLARFSEIVGFNPLNADIYREILQGSYVRERAVILENQPAKAALLPDAIPDDELFTLADRTYLKSQGARPAERAARRHIEDLLMQAARNPVSQPWPAAEDSDSEESDDSGEFVMTDETDQTDEAPGSGTEDGPDDTAAAAAENLEDTADSRR